MSAANKEYEVGIVHPLYQKSPSTIVLGEFFSKGFFDKVLFNMTSCAELDDDDDETSEEQSVRKALPLKRDDKVLTVLEALQSHMG